MTGPNYYNINQTHFIFNSKSNNITSQHKAFIDIRLRPGITKPLATWLTTAKRDVIHKTGSTYRIAMSPKENPAMATWDLHTKLRENQYSSSRDNYACGQTDRQIN